MAETPKKKKPKKLNAKELQASKGGSIGRPSVGVVPAPKPLTPLQQKELQLLANMEGKIADTSSAIISNFK
jgi:hypothetical protein